MSFETFFRLVSYAAVFCGFFALWVSGTFGIVGTVLFLTILFAGWMLDGTRWQIPEVAGTILIVLSLPLFYIAYKNNLIILNGVEQMIAGVLARMILTLTAIKLLQKKSDRDWIFLYLMAFFEVLLAAGLSISALYLGSLLIYLLVMGCAIIAFEIRKTSRAVEQRIAQNHAVAKPASPSKTPLRIRRLPAAAFTLIVFIVILAVPLFFMLPRVGGAGFGGDQTPLGTSSGFSDTVKLGNIGKIQQNDAIVMRVKLEEEAGHESELYFRGVALDTFDNQVWTKARSSSKVEFIKNDRDLIQVDYPASRENLSIQTIYLEPLDTPVLFALPRVVGVQGNFPVLSKDTYGAITYQRSNERVSYKVVSDRGLPSAEVLRGDDEPYTNEVQNYRSLPASYDPRIAQLAAQITENAGNRYDKARAMENYLQNSFGYTLEQKAGGREPLASFLFDVREGHCEYFATAMAVMLRTQGIATRIVNGFHGGEYNDAADVTVVRQRNAHAWVEVYFPKEDVWVPFDPTPFGGEVGATTSSGFLKTVNKYVEALETFWIQYFVAYDNQEQRSLARSVRSGMADYQMRASTFVTHARDVILEWWRDVQGEKGMQTRMRAIGYGVGAIAGAVLIVLFVLWLYRRIKAITIWRRLGKKLFVQPHASIVVFYDRMLEILAGKGVIRPIWQTPLEFAYALEMPDAIRVTEKYNAVRFGERTLSDDEAREINTWLDKLETGELAVENQGNGKQSAS